MLRSLLPTLILFFLFAFTLNAQEQIVQAFNYDSEVRDTVISFSNDDHNKWEKILMIYSMRCKDGLVSPPIAGQTNVGCGEWDYSCNTYITDSSQVDSTFRISPDHVISGFDGDNFEYQEDPTFAYYRSTFKEVTYGAASNEESFLVNNGTEASAVFSGVDEEEKRVQYLIKKAELDPALLTAGNLAGIKLEILNGNGNFEGLKVRMKHSNTNELNCFDNDGWQEVFYQSIELNASNNWLKFYENFSWNGSDDILIDFSFKVLSSDLMVKSTDLIESRVVHSDKNNKVMTLEGSGRLNVQGDFSSISDQITVAFWSKGASSLPDNTTFLEGVNDQNVRQINIHLPWGNRQVYWDCGNDGSGYDRINQLAEESDFKDNWTHWAFTKNVNTGSMKIFKNGVQWLSGIGKNKLMDIKDLRIGSSVNNLRKYPGQFDDLRIWNVELNDQDILESMCNNISSANSNYDKLVLAYDFNNDTVGAVLDASSNQFNAIVEGVVGYENQYARNLINAINKSSLSPSLTLMRGDYEVNINEIERTRTIPNIPNQVDRYIVDGTDLELVETNFYYATGDMPVFDDNDNIIDYVTIAPTSNIQITDLEHYTKAPMQMEIMSFVTPYGINLDLGIEGESWTFDVTDLGPILKGDKRIFLTRGGQWQEDMDIKFLFYEGTPTRNVKSIQQIWPVISTNYTTIMNDERFEPRMISKSSDDGFIVAKTTITGHGQEGEFVPQTHGLTIDNIPFEWNVWMECAGNPIYPQGGTWVYDRAGWCPGAPSMTQETDFTWLVNDDTEVSIDYNVNGGSGDSRYIVSSQLVKYGPANFETDASMDDIVYPSEKIEHGRFNPNCGTPKVIIKNTGSNVLTSATITYGIVGGETKTYEWSGNLAFLETREVELDYLSTLAASSDALDFFAEISNPNGATDEYENNNIKHSKYAVVDMYASDVIIEFKTNNNFTETGVKVFDENGSQIFSRGPGGLGANSTYRDTIKNLNGCYKIEVNDLGQNGLDWWANPSGGTGYVRIRDQQGNFSNIATDFGSFVDYSFIAGEVMVNTNNPTDANLIDIFPNPTEGFFNVTAAGVNHPSAMEIMDDTGRTILRIPLSKNNVLIDEKIDLSNEASGLYFVKIIHDGGTISKKLMKI